MGTLTRRLLSLDGVKVGVMLVRGTLVGASLIAFGLAAASCVNDFSEVPAMNDRGHPTRFVMQPSDMTKAEAGQQIDELTGRKFGVRSGEHLGWVTTANGRADFYQFDGVGTGPVGGNGELMSCLVTVVDSDVGIGMSCRDAEDQQAFDTMDIVGGTLGGGLQSLEYRVNQGVAQVVGTADNGAVVTSIPLNGFGFIEWETAQSDVTLKTLDSDGNVLATERWNW